MAPPLSLKMSDHGTMLRRKEERHSVRAEAKISYRGICSDAMIVDVSAGGLRLDGTFGLMVGDAVVVGLSSGYEATGRVAWSLGAMVGVEFPRHLGAEHSDFLRLTKHLGVTIPLAPPQSGRSPIP